MPYLDRGAPVPIKEYGERRREIDEKVRRLKGDPNVLGANRA